MCSFSLSYHTEGALVSDSPDRITSREIVPAGRISPFFLRPLQVPTFVLRCFRTLFWQQERIALRRWTGTISREAGLFWGWRSACATGRTTSASDLLGRIWATGLPPLYCSSLEGSLRAYFLS